MSNKISFVKRCAIKGCKVGVNEPNLLYLANSPNEAIAEQARFLILSGVNQNSYLCDDCFWSNDASSPFKPVNEHERRIVQAAKEHKAAMPAQVHSNYDFEWESHMDMLMAPVMPEQSQVQVPTGEISPGRQVDVYTYYESGDKVKKKVIGHAELIPMERQEFPSKTIFPKGFPEPIVCSEFCDKHTVCHLREEGIGDLCKNSSRFGKLVRPVDKKWAAWHEYRTRLPETTFANSTIAGRVPETALAHWGSPDAVNEDCDNGNDEWVSPQEQAREYGDKDAVAFVPAFIFASGRPVWKAVTAFDRQGYPYIKMVKYPSIRAVACKVELRDGYVVPSGKVGSLVKITTRADKKRARAYSAIRKELTPYVGAERAGKMAGQQVAAMATC